LNGAPIAAVTNDRDGDVVHVEAGESRARSRFRGAAGPDPLNDLAALLDIGAFRL